MAVNNKIVTVGSNPTVNLDTDATLAGNSDVAVATQKAVKAYIDGLDDYSVFTPSIMTASGAVPSATFVQLNSATPAIAATIAAPIPGQLLVITQIDAGTVGHTVTLAAGTWDGTNDVATFNAPGETLVVFGLTATRFAVILNLGSVAFS